MEVTIVKKSGELTAAPLSELQFLWNGAVGLESPRRGLSSNSMVCRMAAQKNGCELEENQYLLNSTSSFLEDYVESAQRSPSFVCGQWVTWGCWQIWKGSISQCECVIFFLMDP